MAKAATTTPDVIVLDLGLPDMDGLEVLSGLRAWTSVPVIVLSARDLDDAKVAVLDSGATMISFEHETSCSPTTDRHRPTARPQPGLLELMILRIDFYASEGSSAMRGLRQLECSRAS